MRPRKAHSRPKTAGGKLTKGSHVNRTYVKVYDHEINGQKIRAFSVMRVETAKHFGFAHTELPPIEKNKHNKDYTPKGTTTSIIKVTDAHGAQYNMPMPKSMSVRDIAVFLSTAQQNHPKSFLSHGGGRWHVPQKAGPAAPAATTQS